MQDTFVVVLASLVGLVLLQVLLLLVISRGNLQKLGLACRAFLRILSDLEFASKVESLLVLPSLKPEEKHKLPTETIRFLTLLQREGRLVDFLHENIQPYGDEQIGAAVREIHQQCQAALNEHLVLEPVLMQEEGATVEIPVGFNPSAIRLVGNVTGQPPFRGTLRHRGWRVKDIHLAPPAEGQDELVLQPAEVELP